MIQLYRRFNISKFVKKQNVKKKHLDIKKELRAWQLALEKKQQAF